MKMKKTKIKVKYIILSVVLAIICFITCLSVINVKAMNKSIDKAVSVLSSHYTLTPVSAGEYENLTLNGIMKFDVSQYDIEGVGNLSIMKVNIGVMQMATLVITPIEKNLPLVSADYMYMLFNRMSYIEYYNLTEEQDEQYINLMESLQTVSENYSFIEEKETEPTWYSDLLDKATLHKSGKIKDDDALVNMLEDSIKIYSEKSKDFAELNVEQKTEKIRLTKEYSDGLVTKGGISTDVFKKELGEEKTKDFFDRVFFGILNYQKTENT